MKKILALTAAALMLLSTAACAKNEKTPDDNGTSAPAVVTTTKAPVKYVTSGRLSVMEAPAGWTQEHSPAEEQIIYSFGGEEFTGEYKPEICINYDEFKSPEDLVEIQKQNETEMGLTYKVETKTIGGVAYQYYIPEFGLTMLFGTKDGVTVCVSMDEGISVDDPDVIDIVSSISVAPEA